MPPSHSISSSCTEDCENDEKNINILSIDSKIRQKFKNAVKLLPEYKTRLRELLITQKSKGLSIKSRFNINRNIAELQKTIEEIENQNKLNFHIAETSEILQQYQEILTLPVKMSFLSKSSMNTESDTIRKRELIEKYLKVISKYYDVDMDPFKNETKQKIVCENCRNKKDFVIEENTCTCLWCGVEQNIQYYATSYKDIDRVNISAKYTYDRKVHFRDCINQYQGRQNCTIPQKVYDDLEELLQNHHLLVGTKDTPRDVRFSKVTKEHILMFLKELRYAKQYENVTLIHFNMTGKKSDDISHLEDILMSDFDILVETYDKHFKNRIDRVNFISTQYVLYQLLQRHRHPCRKEDFVILKTIDRKSFHDDVCRELFHIIGWNHTPIF